MSIDSLGVYDGMAAEEYHADPCPQPSLSSSIAKIICAQSPLHAWAAHPRLNPDYEPEENSKFDRGSAAHALLLEDADRMTIIDAKDFRTKAAQEARDAARAAGRFPLLRDEYVATLKMREAALKAITGCPDLGGRTLASGKSERSLFWQEDGLWLRLRSDWIANDFSMVWDYKTTTDAAPAVFNRQMARMDYHIQAAFYERGVKALKGISPPFILIAQELEFPFAVSFHGCAPSLMEIARAEVDRAVYIWKKCMASGVWPGYSQQIHWAEAAAWQATEHEERKLVGIPYDVAKLWGKEKVA